MSTANAESFGSDPDLRMVAIEGGAAAALLAAGAAIEHAAMSAVAAGGDLHA